MSRVDNEPGFVLHAYPYKETSLIVEAFTSGHGRIALVARGAKRPRSVLRGVLQAFQPLLLSWSGRGDVKTLMHAEWQGGLPLLEGEALLCGFYVNELLLKLLPRDDPHAALFTAYEETLHALASRADLATPLRRMEVRLLAELGYGLQLERDAQTGEALDANARYYYVYERGPQRVAASLPHSEEVSGAVLLAMRQGEFADAQVAQEAKQLMRQILNHFLERENLFSRQMLQDLRGVYEVKTGVDVQERKR
jgi:DNA repair protein RecO (recombination protein O)